ncbi:MAG: antibiotic biosynthesis monooxygenase family protein [Blastopirellula sp. JB062]
MMSQLEELRCHPFRSHISKETTMANNSTATIEPQAKCLTLINVYEVEPEKQSELADALAASTESTIRHQPGFIHSSFDGTKVVNYAQWATKEDFEGFMKKPETQAQLKQFAGLAKSVAPSLYKVDTVHAA